MRATQIITFLALTLPWFSSTAVAQEHQAESIAVNAQEHGHHQQWERHHILQAAIMHTHVSRGLDIEGNRIWLALPSFALNYNYDFHPKWAIGLHTDVILESFLIDEGEGQELEREYPVSVGLMGTFKPNHVWHFLLGGGVELAKGQNFGFARVGAEPTWHFGDGWEISVIGAFDIKFNAYDAWTIGLGIGKLFGGNPHR